MIEKIFSDIDDFSLFFEPDFNQFLIKFGCKKRIEKESLSISEVATIVVMFHQSGAWAIRELATTLWDYKSRAWAIKAWKRWLSWAQRCRLEPVKKVARMIKEHLWGIINAIVLKANNGRAEGINNKIQSLKNRACGYRCRERYKTAIYFHLGGLDLYPSGLNR